jgi:DNA-binding XRE family transcriptional regulator
MPRQPHKPTDESRRQVETLVGMGMTREQIGRFVGVSENTLRKYYESQLGTGDVKANAKVAQALFRKATGDGPSSVTAAIFWLKARAGWKEADRLEIDSSSQVLSMFLEGATRPASHTAGSDGPGGVSDGKEPEAPDPSE